MIKGDKPAMASGSSDHAWTMAIKDLARKLDVNQRDRPSKCADYSGLRAATVAREILSEGKPLTIAELTVEVQRRGCRPLDDPRVVAHTIRALLYRPGQFRKDGQGQWSVANSD